MCSIPKMFRSLFQSPQLLVLMVGYGLTKETVAKHRQEVDVRP